jgi:hypothetical protein
MSDLEELWADRSLDPRADRSGCPPPTEIEAFARGELGGARRAELLDHLADCADCAAELLALSEIERWAFAAEERLAESAPPSASAAPAPAPWRRFAGWAAAAAVALAAGLAWQLARPGAPRLAPNPAIVDLLPEGALRSADAEAERAVALAPSGPPAVLVLHLEERSESGDYEVEFVDSAGGSRRLAGLRAEPGGFLTLALEGRALPPGAYELRLFGRSEGARRELARYRLRLVAGS